MSSPSALPFNIIKYKQQNTRRTPDVVAVEEPLEIRLGFGPKDKREQKTLAITMRTPGYDTELVLGFLFTEGIIRALSDVIKIDHCTDERGEPSENVIRAEISPVLNFDWTQFERHFYTNSSCGVCGKASIQSLETMCAPIESNISVAAEVIYGLDEQMRNKQMVFDHTGGLHASALFNNRGEILLSREDIGRHNALDKLIGVTIHERMNPLTNSIIMLSGRCCFELVQKAAVAGCPILVSVGAPSSLAIETADKMGVTIIGFTRSQSFNLYTHPGRIK